MCIGIQGNGIGSFTEKFAKQSLSIHLESMRCLDVDFCFFVTLELMGVVISFFSGWGIKFGMFGAGNNFVASLQNSKPILLLP